MTSFKEFFEANDPMTGVPVVAQPNTAKTATVPGPTPPAPRNTMNQAMDQRLQTGKGYEAKIIEKLNQSGFKITPVTGRQDMFDKIDGIWENAPAGAGPIQLKYRDSGYDIGMEVQKNGRPGRDMVGKSVYYGVVPKDGEFIYIYKTADLKALVQNALQELQSDGGFGGQREFRSEDQVELRQTRDPADQTPKIMAFIPIDALPPLKRIRVNLFK